MGISQVLLPLAVHGLGAEPAVRDASAPTECEATQFGMESGGRDNTPAFRKALQACAGRTLHIPRGTYWFSPKGFEPGIVIPENTRLVGDGPEGQTGTVLQIADSGTFDSFLWVFDTSNITIEGIRFEGSSYESGCTHGLAYGHAISVWSSATARTAVGNIQVTGNAFHDFNGPSWITINAEDRSPGIGLHGDIAISRNSFHSDALLRGGCAGSGGIGYPVFMVWIHGSDDSAQGMVENVSISANAFEAGYVKGAVAAWSGTAHISIRDNSIRDAGLQLPPAPGTELGRYAIAIYNSAHEKPGLWPDSIQVAGNTIVNPVSCGVYVASARHIEISRNRISGQTDRNDATLPKGAIALNHVLDMSSVEDNELSDNHIGLTVVAGDVSLGGNQILASPGGIRTKLFRDVHAAPEIQR